MYISCPECKTKFVVTPQQIGVDGRKVKCSKCSNVWHQTLDRNVRIEPRIKPVAIKPTPIGNGVNLPALLPTKISPFLYGLPILLIGMIIFMTVTLFPNVFGVQSVLDDNQVSIKDLQITHNKEFKKITVDYKILNSSNKPQKTPMVRIRLFDKNNRVIKSKIDEYNKILAPAQNISIHTEFVPAPSDTENIDIMLGNKLDFMLR